MLRRYYAATACGKAMLEEMLQVCIWPVPPHYLSRVMLFRHLDDSSLIVANFIISL